MYLQRYLYVSCKLSFIDFFLLAGPILYFRVATGNKQRNTYSYTITCLLDINFCPYYNIMTFYKYITIRNYLTLTSSRIQLLYPIYQTRPKFCLLVPPLIEITIVIISDLGCVTTLASWNPYFILPMKTNDQFSLQMPQVKSWIPNKKSKMRSV